MAKSAEKPLENTPVAPLRPSTVVVEEYDGTKRNIEAEKYDDLLWIYNVLVAKGGYKSVKFIHCSGNELKVQLFVGFRYVGTHTKENIVFENPAIEAIHSKLFTEQ
jgi:hypothetical protein